MSGRAISGKIKINTFDDICGGANDNVVEMPLEKLHEFKNHPFRVIDDEKMAEMVESVKEYGVLVPGIVRHRAEGGYEIIAGHRRKRASLLAGKTTMPVIVRRYMDDEATIIMVDSNIQREDMLISERAHAYRMKYDAMKHQGSKTGGLSLAELGEQAGESAKTVQRYIYLSRLNDDLLKMVDDGKIGMIPGVDLSFLGEEQQRWVFEALSESGVTISKQQARFLKDNAKSGELTAKMAKMLFAMEKPKPRSITLKPNRLNQYFDENWNNDEIEELICSLLEEWKKRAGE
ncbi:MAG: ParB/RepB/Spo0J family partition protein [Lachnospiraceae bacterium]|nr:ParB/RepB/Spo0J family partition protein [Lachnospiraceae bacterium]